MEPALSKMLLTSVDLRRVLTPKVNISRDMRDGSVGMGLGDSRNASCNPVVSDFSDVPSLMALIPCV